ncbi:MAG: glycosyltransferase family 1 protein [Bacteroidales bacterium]|nr:glycosyltransferase family 1 protein [Bacteroidales bacterium]
MKIILISIGTRGDMEPFLAIGEILKEKGHQVICAFPEQFRNLVENSNMEFASLGTKYIEMLDSEVGKAALGGSGSGLNKMLAYIRLAKNQTEANKELTDKQYEIIESEIPDRIVYNAKVNYPIIWGLNNRGKNILVCALPYLHYVRDNTHVVFNSNFGPFLNKLTYSLANFGMIMTTMITKKWLKITRKITRKQIKNALLSNKAIYTISPSLFSRPDYWNVNLKVLGYHERNKAINWRANKDINDFLEKHHRILFITFGSMTNPEPEEKTKIIIEILERNKIPAIINTASGGLIKPDKFDSELLHFVSQIPYDWIFPKIYGVIHHGGSGTTHMALKYGCATMIIPHIIDQFVWNKIIYNLGAGPKGIKIGKITTKNLEPKILELVNNSSFKKKAEQVASQMEKEDFREELYNSIVE